MKKRYLYLLAASLLFLPESKVLAQNYDSGTKKAASAVETLKGLLPGQDETGSGTSDPNTGSGDTGSPGSNTGGTGSGGGTGGTGSGGSGGGTGGTGSGGSGGGTGGTGSGGSGGGTGGTGSGGSGGGTGGTGSGGSGGGTGGTGSGGSGGGTGGTGSGGSGGGTGGTGSGGSGGGTGGNGTGGSGGGTGGTGSGGSGGGTGGTGSGGSGGGTGGTGSGGSGGGTGGTGSGGSGGGTGGTGSGGSGGGTGGTGSGGSGGGTGGTGTSGSGGGTGGTGSGGSGGGNTGGVGGGTGGGNTGSGMTVNPGGSGSTGNNTSNTNNTGSSSIYKPGWNKERVLSYPKGSRPDPTTYLTETYVTDHINRFKQEGGAFMVVEDWIEKGAFNAFPLRKFVMLRSDMEKVMNKYYQTGRVEDIEDALGYRRGDLKGLSADIHIIYVDSTKYKFELPNGNEIGANDLWEPGAKTSGGFRECVIVDKVDPARTIVHNKNPEALHVFDFKELIYKQGWYNKRVRDIPKGTRPNAPDYLVDKYVSGHLQRFNTEGAAFMVVKSWVENGTYNSFPLRKFVMLRSDMDKVVAQYHRTGQITDIEDALGYTRGELAGKEDELYVFFINKNKFIFELPNGNENGANSLWEPEARTSGGFLECVAIDKADPNRPITHNKSIAHLQSQYASIKVADGCIYKPGWSKSRVLTEFTKPNRPDPSVYLTESYITDHLNRFKTEGGAFMIVEKWLETSPYPTFASRKFVMLRSDMDKVVNKYLQTGRVEDIEDALGYKRGDLKGLDAEIHVIYVDTTQFIFELPNGREIGANDLWEPGAQTSGGFRECVLIDKTDPNRTIVHNKDPEVLHTPYEYKELIYKTNWDNKRVRTIPKGQRPNPPQYLIPPYVQNHLQKFNTEGGAFMVVKRWIEDPNSSFMAFPLKKFVMLRSDMDKVIADYRASNNVQTIEDALGYTRGTLTGLEDDLYVFYLNKTKYFFELPTGNEIGANSLWEPEARTSGGFLECVVTDRADPNRPITHNKNIDHLKSQFNFVKVKQP